MWGEGGEGQGRADSYSPVPCADRQPLAHEHLVSWEQLSPMLTVVYLNTQINKQIKITRIKINISQTSQLFSLPVQETNGAFQLHAWSPDM